MTSTRGTQSFTASQFTQEVEENSRQTVNDAQQAQAEEAAAASAAEASTVGAQGDGFDEASPEHGLRKLRRALPALAQINAKALRKEGFDPKALAKVPPASLHEAAEWVEAFAPNTKLQQDVSAAEVQAKAEHAEFFKQVLAQASSIHKKLGSMRWQQAGSNPLAPRKDVQMTAKVRELLQELQALAPKLSEYAEQRWYSKQPDVAFAYALLNVLQKVSAWEIGLSAEDFERGAVLKFFIEIDKAVRERRAEDVRASWER